jgi:hypothetical protein
MNSSPLQSDDPILVLRPSSAVYDADDWRWLEQLGKLKLSLQQQVGNVRQEEIPSPGQKGGAVELIVALGSAGAFTAAIEIFKAWVGRDPTRTFTLSLKTGSAKPVELAISAKHLGQPEWEKHLSEILGKVTGYLDRPA